MDILSFCMCTVLWCLNKTHKPETFAVVPAVLGLAVLAGTIRWDVSGLWILSHLVDTIAMLPQFFVTGTVRTDRDERCFRVSCGSLAAVLPRCACTTLS